MSDMGREIGFLFPHALGDSLILMTAVNNLVRNGHAVTVFGDYARALAPCFPSARIEAAISDPVAARVRLAGFDTVFQMDGKRPLRDILNAGVHPRIRLLSGLPTLATSAPMCERVAGYCRDTLQLDDVVTDNGIQASAGRIARRARQRVAIHPTASIPVKQWPQEKFVALARALHARGLSPHFVVTPAEEAQWRALAPAGSHVQAFAELAELADFLFECAYFIGNDSGIGHLASCLGVPTLSLFMRRGLARTWRPGWAEGRVTTPPALPIGGALRERYWKQLLSARRVARAFAALQAEVS